MKELLEIQRELLQMPEWNRLSVIRQFSLSVEIFKGNAAEISNLLEKAQTDPEVFKLWALENRLQLDIFEYKIARLLHNYVASAFSLVDHTRRFYEKYYKLDGNFRDYEEEVKQRFADDPLCQFVQGLRNYFIHKKVPSLVNKLTLVRGGEASHTVFLLKRELLDFDWKERADQYLKGSNEEIELAFIVKEYADKILSFYKWVFSRLEDIHSKDLLAIRKKREEGIIALGQKIPYSLEADLNILKRKSLQPEQIFLSYMDPISWRQIIDSKPDPIERANAFLDYLQKISPPLDSLRSKIVDIFREYYTK